MMFLAEVFRLGCRTWILVSPSTQTPKSLYLISLVVLPGFRGRGLASELLKTCEGEVARWNAHRKRNDIKEIILHVQSCNKTAIEFYKGRGFSVGEEVEN